MLRAVAAFRLTAPSLKAWPSGGATVTSAFALGRSRCMNSVAFSMNERCPVCGFVFMRGNPAYFSGAIFINYLLGAGVSIAVFLAVLAATWPNVPWNVLAYGAPVGVLIIVLLLHPVSKMILLTVDVRMLLQRGGLRSGSTDLAG